MVILVYISTLSYLESHWAVFNRMSGVCISYVSFDMIIILLVLFTTHHVAKAMVVVDWDLYNIQQQYKKAGGILYKQSVLKPHEYKVIKDELQAMKLEMMDEDESLSFATNRSGAQLPIDTDTYRVLSSKEGSLCRLVNSLFDGEGESVLAPDIPIEVCYMYVLIVFYVPCLNLFLSHYPRSEYMKSKEQEWSGILMMYFTNQNKSKLCTR